MFSNRIRATLVSAAAVAAGLLGATGTASSQTQTAGNPGDLLPSAESAPPISLDELQARLEALAGAADLAPVRAGLNAVIAGLDAQESLVTNLLEPTYLWLTVRLHSLLSAVEDNPHPRVISTVNMLAGQLAAALHP